MTIDENEKKYYRILGDIEKLMDKFRDKGYTQEQLDDILLTLVNNVPSMLLGDDVVKEIAQRDNLSFDEMDALTEGKGLGR